ncbi:MAG TPA: XTP/dITP diphosphatase [Methanocorpusculum sp.]|nr:XTP/dITP diphosphatase [Methanocorpusculum sp.]
MITVVTGNKGKAAEVAAFFSGIEEVTSVSVEMTEPQAESLEEVAHAKAEQAYAVLKRPLIVDDTGLFIEAVNGFPGPYAAYVQDTIGNAGILALLSGEKNRRAYFETVIAYADKTGIYTFSGRVYGDITQSPRGNEGFGYDPIFSAGDKTLAEMSIAEKNTMSHRAHALISFKEWYVNQRNG